MVRSVHLKESLATLLIASYAACVVFLPNPLWAIALAAVPLGLLGFWWMIAEPQRWVAVFLASAVLLPPLPFAFGDSGPHPALLAAAVGLFAGLLRLGEWHIIPDRVTGAVLALLLVLLGSVALAGWYSGGVIAAGSFIRVALFGTGVYVFLYAAHGPASHAKNPLRAVRWLFLAAVLAALFACFDFNYQLPTPAGYGPQFVWLDSGVFRRAQGFFYEASTLGNFCAFFLVMVAAALFRPVDERPVPRPWLLAGGAVLSAALIFSYSRASLLNLVVSLMALAYVRRIRLKRIAVALLGSLCCGALGVYLAFPSFALSYWMRLSGSVQYFWSSPEGILSGRVASWRTLIGFLIEHPWHAILGVGYKTLPYSDFVGRPVIADNMYLSLLVETGIVGLAVFLLFNITILQAGLRAARSPRPEAMFFGTWIFCFWMGQLFQMLSGDLMTYWRVLPVYLWVLAVAVREGR